MDWVLFDLAIAMGMVRYDTMGHVLILFLSFCLDYEMGDAWILEVLHRIFSWLSSSSSLLALALLPPHTCVEVPSGRRENRTGTGQTKIVWEIFTPTSWVVYQ